jgi:hypothetical protein
VTEPRWGPERGEASTSSHHATRSRKPKDEGRSVAFWTKAGSIGTLLGLAITILIYLKPASDSGADTATRIQACEKTHHLAAATFQQQLTSDTGIFASCIWPPVPGADPDGYTAVSNTLVSLPGFDATADTQVRRITGPCSRFEFKFTYGHMGDMTRLPPLVISPDSVIQISYTTPAPYDPSKLPFYPNRGEVDVVQGDNLILDYAGCVS